VSMRVVMCSSVPKVTVVVMVDMLSIRFVTVESE